MKKIIFVCTGNTCRSSMAQALAEKIISDLEVSDKIKVESAGTAVIPGMGAAKNAIDAVADKNIDLSYHKAKQLTKEMIEEADLILTMTQSHKKQVIDVLPDSRNKVFTIKEYTLYKTPGSEKNNIGEKIALLASNLEKKEREFYSKYGNELKELKSKSDQLEKEIKKIEEDIQKWHLKLYEYTDKERHELKLMEEKMCDVDIDDPIGQPLEIYKKCSDELEKLIKIIIEKLL